MKVIFMGTPSFAVPTMKALAASHEVAAVVTQPDKPGGRGNKIQFSPVKEEAIARDIPVLQPVKVREAGFAEQLSAYQADVFVVVAYGQILPENILNMPKMGCINVHGSLLPKYRGAAPIHWAVINGEEKTGVTIMYMDKGMDTGDMILKRELPVLLSDNTGTLYDKMSEIGADLLIEALEMIEKNQVKREKQDDSKATYAPMISKEMARVNWTKSSVEIVNLIRGLNPWPCAFAVTRADQGEQTIKIWEAFPHPVEKTGGNGQPGEVIDIIAGKGFVVKTQDAGVLVTEIQATGGRRMSVCDYLRGHRIEIGVIFD